MADCTCPHIDGYRIKRSSCPVHSVEPAQAVLNHIRSRPACDLCRRVGEHSPLCPVVTMGDRLKDIPL